MPGVGVFRYSIVYKKLDKTIIAVSGTNVCKKDSTENTHNQFKYVTGKKQKQILTDS